MIHRLDPRVIGRNPQQPRQDFDEAAITELADSIRVNGILQPLVVRVNQAGEYELVAGERRLRAAQHLEMAEVPAVVRDVEDSGLLELALIENIQRENLNSIEEAQAFHELREIHGWTQEQLAERLGKKRSTIANTLRLLDLPIAMQVSLRNGKIAPGHAKVLLSVTDPAMQGELHRLVLEQAVSVRELERLSHTQPQDDSPKSDRATRSTDASAHTGIMVKGPHLAEEEELWSRSLGTKVEIREGRGRGKIVLHFFSTDDYQRLKDRLTD